MNNNANDRNDPGYQDDQNRENDKTLYNRDREMRDMSTNFTLPYEDPAITNPEELASFPKNSEIADATDVERESESRLVNRRTPVREGRNITRTDNNPDTEGYM